ncbi:UxaA family hydrolase [Labrenzia sp. PHM005]|uniref:UxaA family hydrolase n=1 Tax=Labrenzia sp. PHM005 TaxID=2590016 RepID=UPI00143D285B|nr:UxaA family hydrolase [Labrenzia sp. PHM005]
MKQTEKLICLHDADNVLVALGAVEPGVVDLANGEQITLTTAVTLGHKVALMPIPSGALVVKYGMPIGIATKDIAVGEHVHVHNIASRYTATHYRDDDAGLNND